MKNDKESRVDLSIILGYIATKDFPTIEKKVVILSQLGFSNSEMSKICNTSEAAIRKFKSMARLKKGV